METSVLSQHWTTIAIVSLLFILMCEIISPVSADYYYIGFTDNGASWYDGDHFTTFPNRSSANGYCAGVDSGSTAAYSWYGQYVDSNSYTGSGLQTTAYGSSFTTRYADAAYFGHYYFTPVLQCDHYPNFYYVSLDGLYKYASGTRPVPSISVSADPSVGNPRFNSVISITGLTSFDTVSAFNITAPNSSVYSLSFPSSTVSIDAEGTWTVRATAYNSAGSSSASTTITGTTQLPPAADFSCSPTNGTSPLVVSCSDGSTHSPTSWHWTFTAPSNMQIVPGGVSSGDFTVAQNYTASPHHTFTGTGLVSVNLEVANSIGSDSKYKQNYITVSGPVPTPTSTPAVPWPNQTGVCIGSSITLGSGQVRDHIVHAQLTDPSGDTYSVQYNAGTANYITGQPFFTALRGQYVYQETSTVDSSLEWQQSYVTDYCTVETQPSVTQTTTGTLFPTLVPYAAGGPGYNPYPVPTFTMSSPGSSVTVSSSWVNFSTIPSALPAMPTFLNSTNWKQTTCSYGAIGGLLCPLMNIIHLTLGTVADLILFIDTIALAPLSYLLNSYNFVSYLFQTILASWLSVGSVIIAVIGQLINVIPDKVKNVVTLIMCIDFFKQCYEEWDWV